MIDDESNQSPPLIDATRSTPSSTEIPMSSEPANDGKPIAIFQPVKCPKLQNSSNEAYCNVNHTDYYNSPDC